MRGNFVIITDHLSLSLIGQTFIYPRKHRKEAIINSVKKLMGTVADSFDVNESLKKLKYIGKDGNEILRKDTLVSDSIFDAF